MTVMVLTMPVESIILGPFNYRATILDPIHRDIRINEFEYNLLQTPFMRRLHNVKQLGLTYMIYPQAKHSRFEHSLGVTHISGQIAAKLALSVLENAKIAGFIFTKINEKSIKNFVGVARLTGLLHDLGHPPYSHAFESVIEEVASSDDAGKTVISEMAKIIDKARLYNIKLHEYATLHFIIKLKEYAIKKNIVNDRSYIENLLDSVLDVLGRTWTSDCSPLKNIKGPSDALEELGLSDGSAVLLASIISNDLADSDRLDYLLRDAYNTGVVFGSIDYHRLIDNLYVREVNGIPRLALDVKGLPTIEHIIEARYRMYRIVYLHHKGIALNIALREAFKELLGHWQDAALPSYKKCIDEPHRVVDPEKIVECIYEGYFLYDDSEFDVMLKNLALLKGRPQRWAASLFSDRRLLPISLVKRPESFIYLILDKIFDRININSTKVLNNRSMLNPMILQFKDKLSLLTSEKIELLKSEIEKMVKRTAGIRDGDVKVTIWSNLIGGKGKVPCRRIEIHGRESSLYIKLVEELSSIPLIAAYVHSDDVNTHLKIHKVREEIRLKTEEIIEEILLDITRRE
jgi:hypothetical protein